METQNNIDVRERPPLSNARLAILVLLGAETMLFSGSHRDISCISRRERHLAPAIAYRD